MRELPRLYLLGPFLPFVGTVSPHSPLVGGPDPGPLSGTLLCAPDALAPHMAVMGRGPRCARVSAWFRGPRGLAAEVLKFTRGWEESGGTRPSRVCWGGGERGQDSSQCSRTLSGGHALF